MYTEYRIRNLADMLEVAQAIHNEVIAEAGRNVHPSEILLDCDGWDNLTLIARDQKLTDGSMVYDMLVPIAQPEHGPAVLPHTPIADAIRRNTTDPLDIVEAFTSLPAAHQYVGDMCTGENSINGTLFSGKDFLLEPGKEPFWLFKSGDQTKATAIYLNDSPAKIANRLAELIAELETEGPNYTITTDEGNTTTVEAHDDSELANSLRSTYAAWKAAGERSSREAHLWNDVLSIAQSILEDEGTHADDTVTEVEEN